MNLIEFTHQRDEILLSLDKPKITEYMKTNGITVPESEEVFWAGVHKAILYINSASKAQKDKSLNWLLKNGFNPIIKIRS